VPYSQRADLINARERKSNTKAGAMEKIKLLKTPRRRAFVRNLIIELILYGVLLIGYFLVVLRYLSDKLVSLYHENTILFAILGLVLIVAQGVVLEAVTSYLIRVLRLDRFK
jgi:uncharacterized protein involved in cysteine biosynthesis